MEHAEILTALKLLGPKKIDNYSEEFITKLYENFSQRQFMQQMFEQNRQFFFEFSKCWPEFLRNNAILN